MAACGEEWSRKTEDRAILLPVSCGAREGRFWNGVESQPPRLRALRPGIPCSYAVIPTIPSASLQLWEPVLFKGKVIFKVLLAC